jgi:hypothetical protein
MNALNRRHALLGWLVWSVFKGYLRQRARSARPALVPSVDLAERRANRPALALAFALVAGVATFVALRLRDAADAGA